MAGSRFGIQEDLAENEENPAKKISKNLFHNGNSGLNFEARASKEDVEEMGEGSKKDKGKKKALDEV